MNDFYKPVFGAIVGALLAAVAFLFGAGGSTHTTPVIVPPSAPALESSQSVVYFCKPDIAESIDSVKSGQVPGSTDFGRTNVVHTCRAPNGVLIRLDATGKFIEAKDAKGLPLTESDIKEYLR